MDREFEGRDEEPVQLNASTSNVVVVDNVRRRLQRRERAAERTVLRCAGCNAWRGRTAQWAHCDTALIGWDDCALPPLPPLLPLLVANCRFLRLR